MLALIIRFVTGQGEIDPSNEEFIKHQLETLQNHIASFPKEQQKQMAMEWIKYHAENYRRNWQKESYPNRQLISAVQTAPCSDMHRIRFVSYTATGSNYSRSILQTRSVQRDILKRV